MSDFTAEAQVPPSVANLVEATKKQLLSCKVAASTSEKVLPFSTNLELRELYINFFGGLRLGKLLEDLDLMMWMMMEYRMRMSLHIIMKIHLMFLYLMSHTL